jgi:chitin synthase
MGNRPQGSGFAYNTTAAFFALLMTYMLFCLVWLTIKEVQATVASLAGRFGQSFSKTLSVIAHNRVFRDLIISTTATYSFYLISSILYLDFLHMFTSFVQYLLLSPSYINIL